MITAKQISDALATIHRVQMKSVIISKSHAAFLGLPWPLPSAEEQRNRGYSVRYIAAERVPITPSINRSKE